MFERVKPCCGDPTESHESEPACRTTFHAWSTFKRLHASLLNAKQVQMWLGHHSPAFTLATYVHLFADDLPDVEILDLDGATGGQQDTPRQAETAALLAAVETA